MISYVKSPRLSICRWAAIAALGCISLSAKANLSLVNYDGFEVRNSGNVWTFAHETAESTRLRGGTVYGASGASVSTSKPLTVQTSGRLAVGTGAVVDVAAKISKPSFGRALVASAKGASRLLGGPVVGLAAGALLDYGIRNLKMDGESLTGEVDYPNEDLSDGYEYTTNDWGQDRFHKTKLQACQSAVAYLHAIVPGRTFSIRQCDSELVVDYYVNSDPTATGSSRTGLSRRTSSCAPGSVVTGNTCQNNVSQKLVDDQLSDYVASRTIGWPTSQALALQGLLGEPDARKLLENEGNGVSVSGPSSVPGEKSQKTEQVKLLPGTNTIAPPGTGSTDPGTKTTTSTETHKLGYSGPNVTTITNVTNITNITNNITNVTTTDKDEKETENDKKPDFCEKNPNSLICKEIDLDTPNGQIPKTTRNIEFTQDGSFGSGYCPSDKYQSIAGQNLLVIDWRQRCDAIEAWVKPVVIALSIFMAFMIVSGASRE